VVFAFPHEGHVMDRKDAGPSRTERLVRSLLLLVASLVFSLIAWGAGAYQLQDPVWIYGLIGGIIVAAILVSRFGARLIMRGVAERRPPP
jgi:hypothetical protein